MRRLGRALVIGAFVAAGALGLLGGLAGAAGAAGPSLTFSASLNGRPLATLTGNGPLVLDPATGVVISVQVTNDTAAPVTVDSVRLDSQVVGLTFFTYTTVVDLPLAPGASGVRSFSVDLSDLGGQATGLLPAHLELLGPHLQVLASQPLTVNILGSWTSVYSVFGIAVAALTLLRLVALLLRLSTRRLPENRWNRAVAFGVVGLGVGLALTFSLSALRAVTPDANAWLPLLVGGIAVGFVVGFLTPGAEPGLDELDELDDDGGEPLDDDHGLAERLGLRPPTATPLPGPPVEPPTGPATAPPAASTPPEWGGSTGTTTIIGQPPTDSPPGER